MPGFVKRPSVKSGLPPGSLIHIGEEKVKETTITILDYNQETCSEITGATVEECLARGKAADTITWINVSGINDASVLEKLGAAFDLHPLVMEDIMNTSQRPKVEYYDHSIYIVMKMLYEKGPSGDIIDEQVSIILGEGYVISFQENEKDVFDQIRERIKKNRGVIREFGADFLTYAIIDAIVDAYFEVVERFEETIEMIEDTVVADPSPENLSIIHNTKMETITLKKSIWPVREVIGFMERGESPLIKSTTIVYFRDVYDHTIRLIESIETIRDMLSGMLDIYLTNVSNRMNEIMKVLTIITTIFIPLSFIAGVYGMNFHNMPEISMRWGYPTVIGVMIIIFLFMIFYFKRKRWI